MEDELNEIFNKEIVREILIVENGSADDVLVDRIWSVCGGNPWNTAIMYGILKVTGKL